MTAQHGEAPARHDVPSWTPGPGDWVVDAIPATSPHGRRRRRGLLAAAAAAALAVAAVVGGVVAHQGLGSGPDSPSEVVEQYLTADQRHDWHASWALLCSAEQEATGSFERYVDVKAEVMAGTGLDVADMTIVVGGARTRVDSTSRSYLVTFWIEHDGLVRREEMGVVEEDGGFRVCGG